MGTLEERFPELHPALRPQEAVVEANRCLFCFDAPCTVACPTHIDVPRFIRKIATGNLAGSASTILESNVLGLSCSRVCPVDVLCEGSCVLNRYNKQPIEIGRLQRHAMDHFYAKGAGGYVGTQVPETGKRVACIGGGPASLACAAELRRHGVAVRVYDNRPMPGGLNTYGVAEYKLTPVDSLREVAFIESLGVEIRRAVEVGATVTFEDLENEHDAVFVGVGLGPTQPLGVDGEHLEGVVDALRFIAEYKTGQPVVGRHVVVVGGGNTAIDAAVAARRLGAEQVRMVYRRGEREMPAFGFEFAHAKQEGVEFLWLTQPVALHGEQRVETIECVRMELGPPDATGRRLPRPIERTNFRIPCDLVITSIGQTKLLGLLERVRGVHLTGGKVVVDPATGQTSNPRYFAAGDCVNGGREVVDAVAEGKRAALGIARWLGVARG